MLYIVLSMLYVSCAHDLRLVDIIFSNEYVVISRNYDALSVVDRVVCIFYNFLIFIYLMLYIIHVFIFVYILVHNYLVSSYGVL